MTHDNLKALCTRKGWKTGRSGCYIPGTVPANKGRKMPFNPNSARTQFKQGGVPANTKYLGHEYIPKDGYIRISVAETNPHTGFERRYAMKHRHLWEQVNGPLQPGMCLKSLDGNRQNADPANWQAIPRALLPRLAGRHTLGYDAAEPELRPVILAAARLHHRVRERAGGE